jgi:hypothetical protein
MQIQKESLLKQQIKDLPFSDELKNVCLNKKIDTLQNLLNIEVYNWHKNLEGFNYHYQHQIVAYLQKNNLMEFLKED